MQGFLNFKLPYTIKKKRNYYVICCPLIDLCTQGETQKKAIANLKEAISAFIISCLERETLDQVFRACGASVSKLTLRNKPDTGKYVNVPFNLPYTPDKRQKACRA